MALRISLGIAFITTCGLLFGCARPPAALPLDGQWLMYQREPSHNAVIGGSLRAGWLFDAGAKINGGLAVVGDTVFLDTFGKELIALDLGEGTVRWRSRSDNILMSTPIVSAGRVFVGTGDNGQLDPGPSGDSTYGPPRVGGSPIWGRPEGDSILAYDARTGAKLWQFQTVGEDMPSPALVARTLVFANGDLHIYGIDVSGRQNWTRAADGLATMASATAVGNVVYLSICNDRPYRCQTLAVDAATGHVIWRAWAGNSDASPTYGDKKIFVTRVDPIPARNLFLARATVEALDYRTGHEIWRYAVQRPGQLTQVGSSERAIAGTYFGSIYYQAIPTSDRIIALDSKTGKVLWKFTTIAPAKMSPVVARGRLYIGDTAGVLYVLDARVGTLLERHLFREPFTTSPPVIIGRTMLVTNTSRVYAFPL